MEEYIVYVKTDEAGHITAVASSGFLQNTDGWTEIDRGSGERYYHAQPRYFPDHILTENGVWRYKLMGELVVSCTPQEIAAQEAALPPEPMSDKERIAELEAALELLLSGVTE